MLNSLKPVHTKKKNTRVGRGYGSGSGGHTTGRGQKGQKSRSGYSSPRPGFEGGSMPLSRRIPKLKGFKRGFAKKNTVTFSLSQLDTKFNEGDVVSVKTLVEKGMLSTKSNKPVVKILSNGEITKKLNLKGIQLSKTAQEKIEKQGGSVK